MRDFAKRVIVCATRDNASPETKAAAAFRVVEELRPHLASLMGSAGFHALTARALALVAAEVHWLRALHIKVDGSWEGLDEQKAHVDSEKLLDGMVVLLAQLFGLLAAFIGENLTLHLVREIWPKLPLAGLEFGNGVEK